MNLWQLCSIRITTAVQQVVEFAKRIPGFAQFSADDQLIIVKVGFFEMFLAQVARTAMTGDRPEAVMTFDDGYFVTADHLARMFNVRMVLFSSDKRHFLLS